MDNTYIVIPSLSLEDKSLSDSEIIVLSVITGLMGKHGFCWASNKYLAEKTRKSIRRLQYIVSSLKKKKYLIIEVEYNNDRKIWTPGTWAYRDKYIEVYGKEIIECQSKEEFNQRFDRYEQKCTGGMHKSAPYNTIDNKDTKHKEVSGGHSSSSSPPPQPPPRPSISPQEKRKLPKLPDGSYQMPKMMKLKRGGRIPTPGKPEMVRETMELLKDKHPYGNAYVRIHPEDYEWFLGFSSNVMREAIRTICIKSKKGKIFSNYAAALFSECIKVVKEKRTTNG